MEGLMIRQRVYGKNERGKRREQDQNGQVRVLARI
jgi:hypothetical protein